MAKSTADNIRLIASNKKAKFEYHFVDEFEAGVMLQGTEVKSIRAGKTNLNDAYCTFDKGELYIRSMYIAEYDHGTYNNHESRRVRKLLLRGTELKKLEKKVKEKGLAIIPYQVYITDRGFVKISIALGQGKKVHDKRNTIKDRDDKRKLDRIKKSYG